MSRPMWIRRRSAAAVAAGALATIALAVTTTATLGGFTASVNNTNDAVGTGSLVLSEQVTPATANGSNTTQAATTCLSTGTGATGTTAGNNTSVNTNSNGTCPADKFGSLNNAKPGDASSSTVVLKNVGTIPANALTMMTGGCTVSSNAVPVGGTATNTYFGTDASYCNKIDITIEDDTAGTTTATGARCVYPALASGVTAGVCPTLSNTYNLATFNTAYGTTAQSILPTGGATVAALTGTRTYLVTVGVDANAATNADQGLNANVPITFTFGQ